MNDTETNISLFVPEIVDGVGNIFATESSQGKTIFLVAWLEMQFPVLSPQSQESASSTRVIRRRSLTSVHFANFPTKTFCLSPSVASKYILSNKLYSQASFYGKNPEFSEKCSALHFPRCKKVNDPSQSEFLNVESLNRNYPLNILIKCGFYFQSQSRHSTPDSIVLQIAASKEMDNFASQTLQPLTILFLNSRQMRVCH